GPASQPRPGPARRAAPLRPPPTFGRGGLRPAAHGPRRDTAWARADDENGHSRREVASTTANEPRPTQRPPVWPVVLIVAGALLLLGNVGWLSWHVLFSLEHLFPPLLVAFGLDMLLQGRHRLPIVVGAIVAFAALSAGAGARLGTSGP